MIKIVTYTAASAPFILSYLSLTLYIIFNTAFFNLYGKYKDYRYSLLYTIIIKNESNAARQI